MMWSLSERFQREFCRKKYLFTLYRSCLLKWQSHDPRGRPVAYIHSSWLHLFGQEAVYDCNHRILLSWKQISWKTQAENSRKMQSQRSICFTLFALWRHGDKIISQSYKNILTRIGSFDLWSRWELENFVITVFSWCRCVRAESTWLPPSLGTIHNYAILSKTKETQTKLTPLRKALFVSKEAVKICHSSSRQN